MKERHKEAGSSLLFFSPPLFPPFLSLSPSVSLMSVLSIGSQCESVAITHTHTHTHTHTLHYTVLRTPCYIFSHSLTLRALVLVQEEVDGASKGTEIVGIHYVVTKKNIYPR